LFVIKIDAQARAFYWKSYASYSIQQTFYVRPNAWVSDATYYFSVCDMFKIFCLI